jgi:hypothetical protein
LITCESKSEPFGQVDSFEKESKKSKMKNGKNRAGAKRVKGDENKPEIPTSDPKTAALNRHKGQCTICSHERCMEIEAAFVAWESPEKIATEFGLGHRTTVYRHAKAVGLNLKRQQNIRVPLERIIERASEPTLQVTGATVVQAIAVYGKLNAQGQLIERRETVNLNELFDRMTLQEKESYAREGKLPEWFTQTTGSQVATGPFESGNGGDPE